jgi:tetratricopeptide (TPR) repeat protein
LVVVALALALACGALWGWAALHPGWTALIRGRSAYARGDFPAAERLARQALKERPTDPEVLRLLARASARRGRYAQALEMYDRLGLDAIQAEDFALVGLGLRSEGRSAVARTSFERALRLDPRQAIALDALADLDTQADRLAEATERAKTLATISGWEARGEIRLGRLLARQSDPAGAVDAFSRALGYDRRQTGDTRKVHKDLARALLRVGRADVAERVLHGLDVGDPEAAWLLSRAELRLGSLTAAADALRRAGGYVRTQVDQPEPAPFVGSAACVECHKDIHRLARGSRHAKTFWPGDELGSLRLPDRPVADPADPNVTETLERTPEGLRLEARLGPDVRRALVAYAVGSGDRGLTPVGRDGSGRLRELRLSRYGDIDGWDVTTGHPVPIAPGVGLESYLGELMPPDDERRCLGCHTTDFRAARDQTGPVAADRGIGCERCHGPGDTHLRAIAAKFPDPAIARPRLADPERVVALCGQCHSPRGLRTVQPTDRDAIRFQAVTLTWSRCYTKTGKGLSCTTCHSPHHDADTAAAHYEPKCLACHAPEPPPQRPAPANALASRHTARLPEGARRVPCPVNPRTNCLDCHMPVSKSTVRHTSFTDHHIRVHRTSPDSPRP